MLCNATAFPPPHRLQTVNETRAGSRERQKAGVRVGGREEEMKWGEGKKRGPQDIRKSGVIMDDKR